MAGAGTSRTRRRGGTGTAIVVTSPGSALSADDLRGWRLGGYKRARRVYFVDELPRNASGKALKGELRDRFAHESMES